MQPFKPEGTTLKVTVSGTASTATKLADNADCVRICNTGTAIAWAKFGTSTVVATSADYPVPAGITEVIRSPSNIAPLFVSIIAAGSTGDCYLTPGSGV
jgi:hypothetical protein